MTKVVYNSCYGGFGLSDKAQALYLELSGKEFDTWDTPRHDKHLVLTVEVLKEEADTSYSRLRVETIEGNRYRVDEYDGAESIMEPNDYHWVEV